MYLQIKRPDVCVCVAQILTPAPDNLLAKRLAEKESMTSIAVGNGLDTPAGMR